MKTSLYRHYDADGVLLYVGISLNHLARLGGHKSSSHWFWDITRVDIEHFETRGIAEAAEMLAIREEKPLHNKMRGRGYGLSDRAYAAAQKVSALLSELSSEDRAKLLKLVVEVFGVEDPTSPEHLVDLVHRIRESRKEQSCNAV